MLNTFIDRIKENNPTTKIVYEMVWGLAFGWEGPGEGPYSYEEYMDMIYAGTMYRFKIGSWLK